MLSGLREEAETVFSSLRTVELQRDGGAVIRAAGLLVPGLVFNRAQRDPTLRQDPDDVPLLQTHKLIMLALSNNRFVGEQHVQSADPDLGSHEHLPLAGWCTAYQIGRGVWHAGGRSIVAEARAAKAQDARGWFELAQAATDPGQPRVFDLFDPAIRGVVKAMRDRTEVSTVFYTPALNEALDLGLQQYPGLSGTVDFRGVTPQ